MAKYLVNDTSLVAVADAIRTKGSTTERLEFPDGFVSAVEGISAGGGGQWTTEGIIARTEPSGAIVTNATTLTNYLFANNTCITSFTANAITKMKSSNVFDSCTQLRSVEMNNVTSLHSANWLFCKCANLQNVKMDNLEVCSANTFEDCTSLTEVRFPKCKEMYSSAFFRCTSLRYFETGVKCSFLRGNEFRNCTSLTALVLRGTTLSSMSNVNCLDGTPIASGTGYIYVPSALVEDYKVATNWSTFASQFRAIEDYPEICGEASA